MCRCYWRTDYDNHCQANLICWACCSKGITRRTVSCWSFKSSWFCGGQQLTVLGCLYRADIYMCETAGLHNRWSNRDGNAVTARALAWHIDSLIWLIDWLNRMFQVIMSVFFSESRTGSHSLGVSNLFVWRATRAIFKVVMGHIIKINKTENNNCCYRTFLCRTSYNFNLV